MCDGGWSDPESGCLGVWEANLVKACERLSGFLLLLGLQLLCPTTWVMLADHREYSPSNGNGNGMVVPADDQCGLIRKND